MSLLSVRTSAAALHAALNQIASSSRGNTNVDCLVPKEDETTQASFTRPEIAIKHRLGLGEDAERMILVMENATPAVNDGNADTSIEAKTTAHIQTNSMETDSCCLVVDFRSEAVTSECSAVLQELLDCVDANLQSDPLANDICSFVVNLCDGIGGSTLLIKESISGNTSETIAGDLGLQDIALALNTSPPTTNTVESWPASPDKRLRLCNSRDVKAFADVTPAVHGMSADEQSLGANRFMQSQETIAYFIRPRSALNETRSGRFNGTIPLHERWIGRDSEIHRVLIKYISGYPELVAILTNLHILRNSPQQELVCIVLDQLGDIVKGHALRHHEAICLALNVPKVELVVVTDGIRSTTLTRIPSGAKDSFSVSL